MTVIKGVRKGLEAGEASTFSREAGGLCLSRKRSSSSQGNRQEKPDPTGQGGDMGWGRGCCDVL